jgi:hypothetical protein
MASRKRGVGRPAKSVESAEVQLRRFMAKYDPAVARDARWVRSWMRRRLPGAVEFIYDTYNWLVIGFGPSERPSEAVFSIVLAPRWVSLCFLEGAFVRDPRRLLRGGGKRVRNIRLEDPRTLDRPEVGVLIDQAIAQSSVPFNRAARRRVIVRAVLERQRPRRLARRARR